MRMSADTVRSLRTLRAPGTLRAVTALVAMCALTQFAIQAWLSYSFAAHVWRIPGPLCVAVIAALDLFVTVFMFLTYLLRSAPLPVRAYAWFVLGCGIGAQLYAAELFAQHEAWAMPVRAFAGLPALFLAASLHGLIKYRQHASAPTEGQGREVPTPAQSAAFQAIQAVADRLPTGPAPAAPVRHVATPAEQAAGRAPVTQRPARVARRADDGDVAKVRELVADGVSCKDAARQLGKSKRWAEGHTKDIRAARDATQGDGPTAAIDLAAIAADGAHSPKEIPADASEIQGDVAGHAAANGTPAKDPSDRF
jgi:hypothetical protein